MQRSLLKINSILWLLSVLIFSPKLSQAQSDSTLESATLERVVEYALKHQPIVQQAKVDESITNEMISGKLADWYPQINFAFNYQRFIDLQSSVIGGNVIRFGVNNTSSAQFSFTQAIFNRDVLLAASTASKVRAQSQQNTSRSKIEVASNVIKAFYDVLATTQQIKVSEESIARLKKSLSDAMSRYQAGVSDKTDYKRATILLGNAEVALKTNQEILKYKQAFLKTLMGYPLEGELVLQFDTVQMENDILIDTTQELNYTRHIDYRMLYTQRELQDANVKYSRWAFLPTISAFGNYNLNYQNNNFGELYQTRYPFSYVGATLAIPIFQGGKRFAKIREQKYTRDRLDLSLANLEKNLSTEYTRSLASYKSALINYQTQKANVELAQEVYDVIQLQYASGIKTYLEVTIAESDLNTTRINFYNSLYQILSSKVDVMKALGQINY